MVELARAQELALRVGDLAVARECMLWSSGALVYGPAPIEELARLVDDVPAELRPGLERMAWPQVNTGFVQGYAGRFAETLESFAEARVLLGELGMRLLHAGHGMFTGEIERLAGNRAAAERDFRESYDQLGELGESGYRSTVGTMLANALVDLGRDDEADEVLAAVTELVLPDDVDPQVRGHWVRARLLARRRELAEAERTAREAVELAAATDYLVLHGNALLALAEVLRAAGSEEEAAAALRGALELFEQKGNRPQAERTRELLLETVAR